MREILFRGKVSDNHWDVDLRGKWIEGNLIHQTKYYGSPVDRYHILYSGEFHCDWYDSAEVIPETIGQFTGLPDKNDKKIFEGDIVRVLGHLDYVTYVNGCFSMSRQAYHYEFTYQDSETIEIIGNIHDNPELLEGARV